MIVRAALLVWGLAFASVGAASAPVVVGFWHSQDATEDLIQAFANEFNAEQDTYRVEPRYTGGYRESTLRLLGAIGSGTAPVLFDAEGTVFVRLAEDGVLHDLADLAEVLPAAERDDLVPILWEYGDIDGARYGLPWNLSLPVLVYNASVLRSLNLVPPTTWQEFEQVAARLTTRTTRGYLDVSAAFIFEALVTTRGGAIVTPEGRPDFASGEAVDALAMLTRMARAGSSLTRSFAQLDIALVDFARTKVMMAIASHAYLPQGERFAVAFDVAVAPVPTGTTPAVPVMGAQQVVLATATEEQRRGAFEFWRFLTRTENVRRWVEASFFLPVTRSGAEALEGWYAREPTRRVSLDALEQAVLRPRIGAYAEWQGFLEEAVERAVRGAASPEAALAEAQRRALEVR